MDSYGAYSNPGMSDISNQADTGIRIVSTLNSNECAAVLENNGVKYLCVINCENQESSVWCEETEISSFGTVTQSRPRSILKGSIQRENERQLNVPLLKSMSESFSDQCREWEESHHDEQLRAGSKRKHTEDPYMKQLEERLLKLEGQKEDDVGRKICTAKSSDRSHSPVERADGRGVTSTSDLSDYMYFSIPPPGLFLGRYTGMEDLSIINTLDPMNPLSLGYHFNFTYGADPQEYDCILRALVYKHASYIMPKDRRKHILNEVSIPGLFRISRELDNPEFWVKMRGSVGRKLIEYVVNQSEEMQDALLKSKGTLVMMGPDNIWCLGTGWGENVAGNILMFVRRELYQKQMM